jgi:3-hydroxybutyrate dehydrogenase
MFKNKTVLVTGSTSGIGLAIAKAFADHNANIILNGIDICEKNSALVEELSRKTSGTVCYEPVDMRDVKAIEDLIARVAQKFGGIDVLINNAGIQYVSPLEAFPPEKWDSVIALNLTAAFHTIRLALPHMRENGWGRIINIASAHGLVGSVEKSAYVAAKHGIVGLTKVTALETAKVDITCNAVCPGWVLTPLVQKQIDDKAALKNISVAEATDDLLFEKQPSMAFVKPEDIGGVAVFLCTPPANQITGVALPVDGGWTAR